MSAADRPLRVGFVVGLSDKKLAQKLAPLQALDEVEAIDLYRRRPFRGSKIRWRGSRWASRLPIPMAEIRRALTVLAGGRRADLLVGCHQSWHGVWAALAGRLWRRPVVQLLITDPDWVMARRPLGWALLAADAIGVRGERAAERLREFGYEGPIEIIANPFDLPAPPREPAPPIRDLVMVGDWAAEKDYPWMVEVLASERRRHPGIRLGIVGRGPYVEHLGVALREHHLEDAVEFLGPRHGDALDAVYLESRALLLTSHTEGLPMVAVEAMALGRPVISTTVGEMPWLLRDGVEGRLVAHGATEQMGEAIAELLGDDKALRRMGRAARARIEELAPTFRLDAIRDAWRRLLTAAIDPAAGRR